MYVDYDKGYWSGMTYKVRSLGMWLKLETGMPLMLLLFIVLLEEKSK